MWAINSKWSELEYRDFYKVVAIALSADTEYSAIGMAWIKTAMKWTTHYVTLNCT